VVFLDSQLGVETKLVKININFNNL
jgi:hypothetical protein